MLSLTVFLAFGWLVFYVSPEIRSEVSVLLALIVLTVLFFFKLAYSFFKIKNRDSVITESSITFPDTPTGQTMQALSDSQSVDLFTFRIIKNNSTLFLPFLISVLVIFVLLALTIPSLGLWSLRYSLRSDINPWIFLPIIFFIYSFLCSTIFTASYLILGYILRRRYLHIKESIFVLPKRLLKSLKLILLLSVIWLIFIFTATSRREVNTPIVKLGRLFSFGSLGLLKLSIYLNFVKASLADEVSSLKSTHKDIYNNLYPVFKIWFGGGLLFITGFLFILLTLFILGKSGLLSITDKNATLWGILAFSPLLLAGIFRGFAVQINLFSFYLKDKYQVDID